MTVDYYEFLSIDWHATEKEVITAYRRLALKLHPDKNPGREREATEDFKILGHAFETLSDPFKRRLYDQERRYQRCYAKAQPPQPPPKPNPPPPPKSRPKSTGDDFQKKSEGRGWNDSRKSNFNFSEGGGGGDQGSKDRRHSSDEHWWERRSTFQEDWERTSSDFGWERRGFSDGNGGGESEGGAPDPKPTRPTSTSTRTTCEGGRKIQKKTMVWADGVIVTEVWSNYVLESRWARDPWGRSVPDPDPAFRWKPSRWA